MKHLGWFSRLMFMILLYLILYRLQRFYTVLLFQDEVSCWKPRFGSIWKNLCINEIWGTLHILVPVHHSRCQSWQSIGNCLSTLALYKFSVCFECNPVKVKAKLGGGFKYVFIFTPTWGKFPIWLMFLRWVENSNQQAFRRGPKFSCVMYVFNQDYHVSSTLAVIVDWLFIGFRNPLYTEVSCDNLGNWGRFGIWKTP